MIAPATSADAAAAQLDLDDIQGLILHGYRRMVRACHLLLRIEDRAAFKRWLSDLATEELESGPFVTVAADWIHKPPEGVAPTHCINIGFTHGGLAALGVAPSHLESFPEDFREGALRRADRVGDTGANDPQHWIEQLRPANHAQVHVVLSLYAVDDGALAEKRAVLLDSLAADGAATRLYERDASALYDDERREGVVHFGYRDGLSQPTIEGVPDYRPADAERIRDPLAPVPPGDFVLGLPSRREGFDEVPEPPELARNGSYAAFRILEQDVVGFERLLQAQADTPEGRELLAARLCGRWRSGAPLVMAPDADPGELPTADLNAFDFAAEHPDPAGRLCPLQSHIRRANPRRQPRVPGDPDLRRIIRRGLPYGKRYDPTNPDLDEERGLVALFICGNLAEQFEFTMRMWINNGAASMAGVTRDPLTGNIDAAHARFSAPGDPPVKLDLPRFVTTRGGLYLFLPGMKALDYLASLA